MTIRLGQADLSFLLHNAQIGTDYSQLSSPLDPSGMREVNGANNNLVGGWWETDADGNPLYDANGDLLWHPGVHSDWGQADTPFLSMFTHDTGFDFANGADNSSVVSNGTTYGTVSTDPSDPGNHVFDPMPRLISNLITSSVVDPSNPAYNPAAVAAMNNYGGAVVDAPATGDGTAAYIPNPGILGGIPYNMFSVVFGQFFDHGLDFISKNSGFVFIQLSPSDPLYSDAPGAQNMMMLSRASLANPDTDFVDDGLGNMVLNAQPVYNNNTGLMIDQSQTYGSDASINALLREYTDDGIGTGKLIAGNIDMGGLDNNSAHDLATWADMKANALRIGVVLTDEDVFDAPALRVNAEGELQFTVGDTDWTTAQVDLTSAAYQAIADTDPFVRDADGNVVRTHQAILIDIAVNADPSFHYDIDPNTGTETVYNTSHGVLSYDADLLDRHYVSGDGRVNENAGLTSVHHVFHEEHNIQADNVMNSVLAQAHAMLTAGDATGAAQYINDWTIPGAESADTSLSGSPLTTFTYTAEDGSAVNFDLAGVYLNAAGGVDWNGDYVFASARIITETEYNHIAVDQYLGILYPAFPEFVSYSSDINLSVSIEFSQAVFRLGHSLLTEQMQFGVQDANGINPGEAGWDPTFTNDADGNEVYLFDAFLNPDMYGQYGASGIAAGLIAQQAQEVDEFVTPAVQQSLLGQPLDLAALNIARGRDVGLPTLNEMREQAYNGLIQNNPNINGSSIAPYTSWSDFGAALRTPDSLVNFIAAYGRDGLTHDWGINEARDAYLAGDINSATGVAWTLADVRDTAQAVLDAYADAGNGLHAAAVEFLDGSPFFNTTTGQWDFTGGDQGFWDIDLWVGGLAERPLFDGPLGTTFSFIMLDFGQRMQDGDRFYYLYRMPVGHHLGDQIIGEQFIDLVERTTGLEHSGDAFGSQSERYILNDDQNDFFNAFNTPLGDGMASDGHIIVAGLGGHDYIRGGLGDDYLYGDDGNDTIQGSQGNDHLYGGAGNDFITDDENDDFIDGGDGDDIIFAGPGVLDTSHGGRGNDEVHGGDGVDEVFGDDGDDALFGEGDTDLIMGGDGNDYMEGGDSVDEMFGGNGNDWMRGGVGDDNINGGSGNDLMEGGLGPTANDGDRLNGDSPITAGTTVLEYNGDGTEGDMDIASYEEAPIAIIASLQDSNANGTSSNLLDTYAYVEGLVGSALNDTLTGADENTSTSNGPNNYLIGGGGNDTIDGLGGDDYIFGDNTIVDIELYTLSDPRHTHGAVVSWITTFGEDRPVFEDGTVGHLLGQGVDGNDNLSGGAGNDRIDGGGGNDTISGGTGADMLFGGAGNDYLDGGTGDDMLWSGTGTSNLFGGAGSDRLSAVTGGTATMYGGTQNDFYVVEQGATATIVEFAGQGWDKVRSEIDFTLSNNLEVLQLSGTAINGTGNGSRNLLFGNAEDNTLSGRGGNDDIEGRAGNDMLFGNAGADTLTGGLGNDTVMAGGGNDLIIQNGATDGHDVINGQAGMDTYQLETGSGEEYTLYTRSEAETAGYSGFAAGTEIVVVNEATGVIAELDNIEEIVVNSATSGAIVHVVGDFTGTSLNYNTITVNGSAGNDTVDISRLTSDHRLVFNSNGGEDSLIGMLRPQDVVDFDVARSPGGSSASLLHDLSGLRLFEELGSRFNGETAPLERISDLNMDAFRPIFEAPHAETIHMNGLDLSGSLVPLDHVSDFL